GAGFATSASRAHTDTSDPDRVRDLAGGLRRRLSVPGGTSYPRAIACGGFAEVAPEVGARLHVDLAHVAGLVAAGVLPSPVPHADTVAFTTYKTMLGPHGGVLLPPAGRARASDRAALPRTQGAPARPRSA